MVVKRRGPYATGTSPLSKKVTFHVRVKEEVLEFIKIGGDYHGVGFQTYLQWLLERALLDEIHYYGWDSLHPLSFDRQHPRNPDGPREFIHLDRVVRRAYASGTARNPRTVVFHTREKEDLLEFLKVGGTFHGVRYRTYLQWLLERALLDEIHYYGWDSLRPLGFDRQLPRKPEERRELVHLDRVARHRAEKANKHGAQT
jgi:predicted DNA binding CopG/RHH family protein